MDIGSNEDEQYNEEEEEEEEGEEVCIFIWSQKTFILDCIQNKNLLSSHISYFYKIKCLMCLI